MGTLAFAAKRRVGLMDTVYWVSPPPQNSSYLGNCLDPRSFPRRFIKSRRKFNRSHSLQSASMYCPDGRNQLVCRHSIQ